MVSRLGAIGSGHWFERLYSEMRKSDSICLAKVAGVSPVEGKLAKLVSMGIGPQDYFMFDKDARIPERFFEGLDMVHISDPNNYHMLQTIESLQHGKITITEKTWGINEREYREVVSFIRENGLEGKAYLHLHYAHKQLTLSLAQLLERYTPEYGPVAHASATLFEEVRDEDRKRSGWLFSPESGGLFMDTSIHLCEILVAGAKAESLDLSSLRLFAVNPSYDTKNPTGIESELRVGGRFFSKGATAALRVAKGMRMPFRGARLYFESGAYLDLQYVSSDIENGTRMRGSWSMHAGGKEVETGCATGGAPSQIFVRNIADMCGGRHAGLSMEEIEMLFRPQWQYQERARALGLVDDQSQIEAFSKRGEGLS